MRMGDTTDQGGGERKTEVDTHDASYVFNTHTYPIDHSARDGKQQVEIRNFFLK